MNFWKKKYPMSLIEIDYDKFVLDYEKNSKLLIKKLGLNWDIYRDDSPLVKNYKNSQKTVIEEIR